MPQASDKPQRVDKAHSDRNLALGGCSRDRGRGPVGLALDGARR